MSVTLFNFPGLFLAGFAFAVAFGLRYLWVGAADYTLALAALFCITFDLTWRFFRGTRNLINSKSGGTIVYIPLWLIGVLWLGLACYQTFVGPVPAATRAATLHR